MSKRGGGSNSDFGGTHRIGRKLNINVPRWCRRSKRPKRTNRSRQIYGLRSRSIVPLAANICTPPLPASPGSSHRKQVSVRVLEDIPPQLTHDLAPLVVAFCQTSSTGTDCVTRNVAEQNTYIYCLALTMLAAIEVFMFPYP